MAIARPTSLRNRALAYLATREHSRAELARKLARPTTAAARAERSARSGADGEAETHARTTVTDQPRDDGPAIEALLDDLETRGLLSTARYVDSVLHRRGPRLGAARIRQELRAQGVPDAAMRDSLQALAETEEARAREVWQRRYGVPPTDAKEAARQTRFLMARGFAAAVVQRVLRRPLDDHDHDHQPDLGNLGRQTDDNE